MIIRQFADDDKPREKAMTQGPGALTDAELLAILLRTGVPGKNVIEVSREILANYGNDLSRLAKASPRELSQIVSGIGPAKAVTIMAALELGSRCRSASARERVQMTSSHTIYSYLRDKLQDLTHEEFRVMMLNKRLCVDYDERVSTGGIDSTLVDVRMLMKRVLDARAVAIVVAHNHPSGSLTPSMHDNTLTRRIKEACAIFDIRLVDHLIISSTGYYSYADHGRL